MIFKHLIDLTEEVPSEYRKQVPAGKEANARYKCPWCGDSSQKVSEWENNKGKCSKCGKSMFKPGQKPLAQEGKKSDGRTLDASSDDTPVINKAAVLAFLKDCDAKCRADVKKKLDKMVAADEAEAA